MKNLFGNSFMTGRSRFVLFSIAVILSLILIVLSTFVHLDFFRQFDFRSMISIQKISRPQIDFLFSLLTILGSTEMTFLVILIIISVLFIRKKNLYLSIFLYILIYPLELLGKLLIYHPKPPVFLSRYVFDFHLPSSFIIETSYSYPSGHMARSAFLVSLLVFLIKREKLSPAKNKFLFLILIIYLFLMFISRIYLGEHWFSDVLGGTILGIMISQISLSLW
ncbi:hypothetical protein A3D78_07165 [Candidatus Gottesmanbacteria bacterium RIFCSPHIGHO2_02_FULL_39_14]|uniref:Phosphatidic acid phosphatase type 2/haloperoxidase domain-containing protein n=3 Tax=Candidatus Gottesmaniibacteriota TaxID=1752720 RepID=A0A1F5ZY02_9BACT|nr:MAG: hypothetical protein A2153_00800 [Candidatus Gottesmanbacteria bacterium RBG_16_38_7b]OGG17243.1 MAG: hypothetical protein A3D78_07165 [Candidatus Gottesmanbacteria bacterium RIFCSPHIGHO2_02_FULL_39_14]OGG30908.1 MAG: hypothetical protein A3I51_04880 [Candidatus Gottesmanbacteria bacterium RIFCSPLOWO2_02_FULL_38_8]